MTDQERLREMTTESAITPYLCAADRTACLRGADALALVEQIAQCEPFATGDACVCFFCYVEMEQPHTPDCLWQKARALVTLCDEQKANPKVADPA